ncbi:reverse transcriptase [Senna tora]|uniref:Reverse transcriptase n=1 Tax=Senna tora TaxID=362788 RepID=A0A835C5F6_9FABA|nr:reverse transcriptase [Senna tora]
MKRGRSASKRTRRQFPPKSIVDDMLVWSHAKNGQYVVNQSNLGFRWSRDSIRRIDDWWVSIFSGSSGLDDDVRSHIAFLCWQIWKDRCSFIYQKTQIDPFSTALRSMRKVNCDGAFDVGRKVAGVGVIFRDCNGTLVDGLSKRVKACSPFMAEAFTLEAAVNMFEVLGATNAIIESDCQILVEAVCSGEVDVD